jgi:hypothetical protein
VANGTSNNVSVLLNNGDGTFGAPVDYGVGSSPTSVAVGDFNGDGALDLAVTNGAANNVSVLLNDGHGGFQAAVNYAVGSGPTSLAVGDFNGDGKPDLAVTESTSNEVGVLLNKGDGTFQAAVNYRVGEKPGSVAAGDFNGDGKLDLAVANNLSNTVSVLLGQGNGSFQAAVSYEVGGLPDSIIVGDYNGDGAPDLAVVSSNAGVTVLLNLGGTFVTMSSAPDPSNFGQTVTLTAAVAAGIQVPGQPTPTGKITLYDGASLIGSASLIDGAATFMTSTLSAGTHAITAAYSGDSHYNPNTSTPITQTVTSGPAVMLSPTSLTFATQIVGLKSAAQNVTLTNTGGSALAITSIAASGDFAQTNTCGSTVNPGASCTISVTFTPTASGTRTGSLTVSDNAPGNPQTVALTGIGTVVSLAPSTINFGSEPVGTKSPPRTVTLTNHGKTTLTISQIGFTGADSTDFGETNTCGTSVRPGASCAISITFTPKAKGNRTATLDVTDNGGGSPQTVVLSGSGT